MASRRQFRFIKEIARGGFGTVYMAEMVTGDNFSTVVAIKLLHAEWADHEEILMRSRDEARLLGRLRHRNIVRVEDLTYIQGHCAVIMEYLEGVDLKSLMGYLGGKGLPFPTRMAFEVTSQVASAMDSAYNYVPLQGGEPLCLIHRDIKPSNVMVTTEGDVKLLDFGTARANFDSREAHTESLSFGSQAYMAPERFMGDPDAPAGDVFSLGVSLYELLAGENIGRILLREDRFFDNLDSRLAALPLDTMPESVRQDARKVMRLMMDYEAENRPTSAQVVDLMEILAEKSEDDGMRRFSRKHVRSALEANPHQPGEDSLQGNTMVEDRSATFETQGFEAGKVAAPVGEMPADAPVEEEEDPSLFEMEPAASDTDSVPESVVAVPDVEEAVPEPEVEEAVPEPEVEEVVPEPEVEEVVPEPIAAISGPGAGPPLPVKPVKPTGGASTGASSKVPLIAAALLAVVGGAAFLVMGGEADVEPEVPKEALEVGPVIEEILNRVPSANAGADQSVRLGQSVSLKGIGADEDEEDTLSFSWSLESAPNGSRAGIAESEGESIRFKPDKVGRYSVQLTVSDSKDSVTDSVSITVTAPPPPGAIRISFFPIGGAEAMLTGPGGTRYSCPKNPHCMSLEASGLAPGSYTVAFTARGKSLVKRKVNVRSSKQCIYKVESDSSVVNTKCQ